MSTLNPAAAERQRMIQLGFDPVTVDDVRAVAARTVKLALDPTAAARMERSQAVLQAWLRADRPVYGLTRGLGNRAVATVPAAERARFSEDMLRARASGVGAPLEPRIVRAALFVRAATLAQGGAGARPAVVETQIAMLDRDVVPYVPSVGSIGTSDLMLCANMGLPLVGLGRAYLGGELLAGADAMRRAGIAPLVLTEKEGLALCSSNAVSIGFGALVVAAVIDLIGLADATLAMSLEAFGGNPSPFDARVAAAHPAPGQREAAERVRTLLSGSALFRAGVPRRIQDPISFRCATHVHGSALTALGWARDAVEAELNCSADNPLILPDDDDILSTGNFHSGALAVAFDALRLALIPLGTASAQRLAQLLNPDVSGLADKLTRPGVTRSGLGILALTAHALNREARTHAMPVCSDDATPFGVEDEAPFTLLSVRHAAEEIACLEQVLACEMIVAAQALDVRPLDGSAAAVQALHSFTRRHVAPLDDDRSLTEDIERLTTAIRSGEAFGILPSGQAA